ncbi:MAG TPA: L-rhamnose mutarotase [Puia sp.]|nr:L-rhamnose mutarotase [Puia sp.]
MEKLGFVMRLHAGCEEEYRRRHAGIWPELAALLRDTGIREYSIFLDVETLRLFAVLSIDDAAKLDSLAAQPVMRRWWDYMKDLMDTNADHSPVVTPLKQVFYLA